MTTTRSAASVTFSTWKALFLREAVNRLSTGRAAWLWVLFEPLSHVVLMVAIFSIIRMKSVGGVDVVVWLMIGMLAFFTFRRPANQSMNAISANRALFSYRQVKPVDTVLVRAGVEGFLMLIVSALLLLGAAFFGHNVVPSDPLRALAAFVGVWLIGLGYGLISSAAVELIPELGKVFSFVMTPMYIVSGVMIPVASIPYPYQNWLLYNPVVHGLESARLAFAPYYHAVPGLSLAYVYVFALMLIFFGLALHVRFANRLVMQ